MQDIKELTLEELQEALLAFGSPTYHAKQVFSWIYQKNALAFESMTSLPAELRRKLGKEFFISSIKVKDRLVSRDGTTKLLFELKDKNLVEAVIIPADGRVTGCISSQAGCRYCCRFCASGMSGFKRNLTQGEIIEEVILIKKHIKEGRLTHVVFMGTGEPFDNYDNVLNAVRVINSADAFNIGARRITISTSGVINGIKKLSGEGLQIELSVSLHAADKHTRDLIMPVNRIYPLEDLIEACKDYIARTNRQVTFEYILIKDLNCDLKNAGNLGKLLKGMNAKVNLIPANLIEELNIAPPGRKEVLSFKDMLLKLGINVTLRKPRGADIAAACGQLRLRYEK